MSNISLTDLKPAEGVVHSVQQHDSWSLKAAHTLQSAHPLVYDSVVPLSV